MMATWSLILANSLSAIVKLVIMASIIWEQLSSSRQRYLIYDGVREGGLRTDRCDVPWLITGYDLPSASDKMVVKGTKMQWQLKDLGKAAAWAVAF